MDETQPEVPGRRRRWHYGAIAAGALSGLVLGVVAAFSYLALTGTPIEAPDWVTRSVETRLNDGLGGGRVSVGGIELTVDQRMVPRVRLRNVGIFDATGLEIARLNEVGARLAAMSLLQGQVEMHTLRVSGAQITVRRLSDGTFDLRLGTGVNASGNLAGVLEGIETAFGQPPLAQLERIEATSLTITLEDARSGRLWQVTEGRIALEHDPDSIAVTVTAEVFNGTEDLASTVLEFRTEKGSPEASLHAVFENAAAADIAAQSPALSFLEVLDAPISGSLSAAIGQAGDLRQLGGTLDIGRGVLQPTPGTEPIRIDGASARVTFDAASQRLGFEEVTIRTAAARGVASGQAFLKDFANGWPETLVAQFQLRDVTVQPKGLFAEPRTFDQGAVDFRLRLDPFSVEIGQLALQAEGQHSVAKGTVSAGEDGWNVALDLAMDSITLARLLDFWPVTLATNTRTWLEKNVQTGRITGLSGAFRLNPRMPQGLVSLSYGFEDAQLTPMKTLPPIEGAAGYSTLSGTSFNLVLERGYVIAPEGGAIDIAGSHMRIADVTAKPGIAELALKTDSPMTAALSLLDLPPFQLMTKAGLRPDVADGRARVRSDISFALKKRVELEDVSYDVAGTLEAFRSDRLVKGRTLSSDLLELRANSSGLVISGEGRLGEVGVQVTFSQEFGPDNEGARVEGNVALGQAFLDEFGITFPGTINGEAVGSMVISIPKQAPPTFELVSDLNRVGLSFAPLNWTKARNETGRLEVAGTLGDRPSVDKLVLSAAGLEAEGRIALAEDGGLDNATFDRVSVGGWLNAPVTLTGRGKDIAPSVTLNGGTVDLRQASFGGAASGGSGGGAGSGAPMSLSLDRLIVSQGIAFTNFAGVFDTRQGMQGRFNALLNGQVPVNGSVVATPSGNAVRLISDNAGEALAAAGILKNARGGSMDLTLNPTGAEGVYDGHLSIRRTRIIQAPAMTDLLSAISIVGLLDQLNSGGITMTEIEADFRLSPSRLTLLRSSGVGPSLGISLDGIYDLATGAIDMQGVLSPVYFLNGIGQVFSRRGEGVFGFNFRLRGQAENLDVSVNPLSILTPGMFREIFRRPPPEVEE